MYEAFIRQHIQKIFKAFMSAFDFVVNFARTQNDHEKSSFLLCWYIGFVYLLSSGVVWIILAI